MREQIREQLATDGYVVLEDFLLPAEVDELLEAGQELTNNIPPECMNSYFTTIDPETKNHRDKYFLESNDKIHYFLEVGATNDEGKLIVDPNLALNKVGHALHYLHPLFRCYTYSERVKHVCRKLGFQQPAVVQSMYIYKNPGIGGEVKPHQDATYLHTSPIMPVGFWIPLVDATTENGCLWIVPGSHQSGVHRRLVRNPEEDSKAFLIYDRGEPLYPLSSFVPVPVKKGSCVLLHGLVVHKSAHNKSDLPRPAYTFHVVEKNRNIYSPENWLQEGPDAPFHNLYHTPQML